MSHLNILDVRFFAKKPRGKKSKLATVYARIKLGGVPADASLKKKIDLDHWDPETGRATDKHPNARNFNRSLDQVSSEITDCFYQLKYQKLEATAETVRNLYIGDTPKEHTLCELVTYHNTHLKHTIEKGTLKNYWTTQKYIEAFLKKNYKVSDIPLSKLSHTFIVDFQIFLLEHKPQDHHKPCGHNTSLKHIERLRKMINEAIKNEWLEKDPFSRFQARFINNDREALTEEEVELLEQTEIKNERLSRVRDLFVFAIYTGLSYSDLMALTSQNLTIGIDGERWIVTTRQKTKRAVRVPLLPKALEILDKYKDDPQALAAGKLFPTISNQKINQYLKEVAELCGIITLLTFHLARHTFATTIALANGVPIETVSEILGHATLRMTQKYAKVLAKKISQDMATLRANLARKLAQKQNAVAV